MKVWVRYIGNLQLAAGLDREAFELPLPDRQADPSRPATLGDLIAEICRRHGAPLSAQILGATGKLVDNTVFVVAGESQCDLAAPLPGGAEITVLTLSPMVGG